MEQLRLGSHWIVKVTLNSLLPEVPSLCLFLSEVFHSSAHGLVFVTSVCNLQLSLTHSDQGLKTLMWSENNRTPFIYHVFFYFSQTLGDTLVRIFLSWYCMAVPPISRPPSLGSAAPIPPVGLRPASSTSGVLCASQVEVFSQQAPTPHSEAWGVWVLFPQQHPSLWAASNESCGRQRHERVLKMSAADVEIHSWVNRTGGDVFISGFMVTVT